MAKFAIECPKCGSINAASTFIFAKKAIKCGTCGEEINIKESRLTSKTCPYCGKVFVCDQAKSKDKKCPSCGMEINIIKAATAEYKMETVNCPQCACSIEVDKTKDTYFCPICDCQIDVKKELAKSRLVSDTGVSVIQYEGDNSTFVWKHPIEDFNLGSQLIVHESQEAVFFLNGEALDTFGPGRHTLETENLPVLKKIYALPTGAQTPFHAEVYFINLTTQMGMKWGTDSRVRFIDPATGIPLDIGASGEMNLQVKDSRKLLFKLVGTTGGLANKAILSGVSSADNSVHKTLQGYFRAPLMNEIKSYLAATIKDKQINILEIDAHMGELSEALRMRISPKFEEYGLYVSQFYITNILLPEEDKNFRDIKSLISDAYIKVKAEQVQKSIAEAAQQRQIVEEQTKAQLNAIRAQGEAEAIRAKGFADAEVMRAKGYTQKDVLDAEVQKAYAEGMGDMGGRNGTAGGGMASDMVGMMAGMKMVETMFGKMDGMFGATNKSSAEPMANIPTWVCSCGESENTKKYCMNCGKPKPEASAVKTWTCPICGEADNTKGFCMNCGAKKPEANTGWTCVKCGEKGNMKNFCMNCGAKKAE